MNQASPRASRSEKRAHIAEETTTNEISSSPQPAPLKTRSMSVDISVLASTGSDGDGNNDPDKQDGTNATSPSKVRSVSQRVADEYHQSASDSRTRMSTYFLK